MHSWPLPHSSNALPTTHSSPLFHDRGAGAGRCLATCSYTKSAKQLHEFLVDHLPDELRIFRTRVMDR